MTSTQQKIIDFFSRHPQYFREALSNYYPFSHAQIKNYSDRLDWDGISQNIAIDWNTDIIDEFKDKLAWDYFSTNEIAFVDPSRIDRYFDLIEWHNISRAFGATMASNAGVPWSIELIEKYQSKIDFEQLSYNDSILWTEEMIDRFKHKLVFLELKENPNLPWSMQFFEKYSAPEYFGGSLDSNKGLLSVFEIVDKYKDYVSWHSVSSNGNLPWIEMNLLERWSDYIKWSSIAFNEKLMSQPGFYEQHADKWFSDSKKASKGLAYSECLPWTVELIEKYQDCWDWEDLSENPSLPWDEQFVKKFIDKIHWGRTEIPRPDQYLDFLERDKLVSISYRGLCDNKGFPWTIDFLIQYEDKLHYEVLQHNKSIWDQAFKPYITEELIDVVLGSLRLDNEWSKKN